jgi:hypothetical protein
VQRYGFSACFFDRVNVKNTSLIAEGKGVNDELDILFLSIHQAMADHDWLAYQ